MTGCDCNWFIEPPQGVTYWRERVATFCGTVPAYMLDAYEAAVREECATTCEAAAAEMPGDWSTTPAKRRDAHQETHNVACFFCAVSIRLGAHSESPA